MSSLDQYTFTTANVVIGDASVPGYSIKPKRAGILELSKVGGLATVEIDGDIDAHGLRVLRSGAERVLISGPDRDIASSFYPGSYVGDAGGMVTGVVDPARIAGDYDMGNLVVTDQLTASNIHANIDAGYLVSGHLDDARLGGSYHCNSLTVGSVTADTASGNLHTSRLVEGTLDPGRLQGQSYAFQSLALDGNATAHTVAAQVDAAHIVSGVLSPDRIGDGAYSVTYTTTTSLDVPTLILSGQPTQRAIVSVGSHVVTSNTTVDELEYMRNLDEPIQIQLDRIREGLFDGNALIHLDASQLTLGTVPDARVQGSFSFDALTLANAAHASTVSANLDAADLTTGTIDPARIAGSYTNMTDLTVTGTLETATLAANIDATDLVSGVVDDQRLGGSYAFDSLAVANTVDAAWAFGNIDTANLVSGVIPVERLELSSIETNLVSSGSAILGGQTTPWTFLEANTHHVDDLYMQTAIRQGTASMQLDLAATSTNIVPLTTTYTVGTSAVPWSNVYLTNLDIRDTLTLGGQMYRADGTPFSFDMENVPIDILPEQGRSLWFGTDDARWGQAVASHVDAQTLASPWVTSSLVPDGPGPLDLGSPTHHWRDIHAANITGAVDGAFVGDVWAQVEYLDRDTGSIVAVDGVKLPSERTPLRFFPDETTGLGLVDGTVPGKLDFTVDGRVVTVVEPGSVVSAANIVPMTTNATSLGRADAAWSRLFTSRLVTPVGTLGPVGSSNIDAISVDVSSNLSAAGVSCSGTVSATTAEGTLATSYLTGTVQDGHFDGAYSIESVEVANTLTLTNAVTCGHLIPSGNAVIDLGAPDARFRDMYVSNTSIHLGRVNVSEADTYVTLSSNLIVTNGISGDGIRPSVSISSIQITNDAWQPIDDTAISSSGGYLIVYGAGFGPGSLVKIADTNAVSTGYVDATQLRVQVGPRTPGTYDISVIRGDTKTATLPVGITFSDAVTWVSASLLGNVEQAVGFSIPLQATSDSQVTYSPTTALPPGTSLNSGGGLSGTIETTEDTIFSFDIRAQDQEYQDAIKTFLLHFFKLEIANVWTGAQHSAALTKQGTLFMWGRNNRGQFGNGTTGDSLIPIQVSGGSIAGKKIVSVALGSGSTIVLASDSTVHSAGNCDNGRLGNGLFSGSQTTFGDITSSFNGKTITHITTTGPHALALASDGSLFAWGYNRQGQVGDASTTDRSVPVAITGSLSGKVVLSIGAGNNHSIVTTSDSSVFAWGRNNAGMVGDTTNTDRSSPVDITGNFSGKTITSVSVGVAHNIALASDGSVFTWGWGSQYRIGDGTTNNRNTPFDITSSGSLSGKSITTVYAGGGHTMAIANDGSVSVWGANDVGQLGIGSLVDQPVPTILTALSGRVITSLALYNHTLALENTGNVFAFGDNTYGQLGDNSSTTRDVPVEITPNFTHFITNVWTGAQHSAALTKRGTLFMWGRNNSGQLGNGTTGDSLIPIQVSGGSVAGKKIVSVALGAGSTIVLASDSTVHSAGSCDNGRLGNGLFSGSQTTFGDITSSFNGKTITHITTTGPHALALASDGSLFAWGYNRQGQVGDASTTDRSVPVAITGSLSGKVVLSIGAGNNHSIVTTSDSSVFAWGFNNAGQVGDTTNTSRSSPVDITGNFSGKTITSVSVGNYHNIALASDGSVFTWGRGSRYRIGDGTTNNRNTPFDITSSGSLSGKSITTVYAGGGHTMAIANDGSVSVWGRNDVGQLGIGSLVDQPVPTILTALSGRVITSLALYNHTLALENTGNVFAFGDNTYGQLGDNSSTTRDVPVEITPNFTL